MDLAQKLGDLGKKVDDLGKKVDDLGRRTEAARLEWRRKFDVPVIGPLYSMRAGRRYDRLFAEYMTALGEYRRTFAEWVVF